eukprot:CAMPEP_0204474120 /NCGR_PEP_ID=MMETSP0471-20130131/24802_1 /ASSEMBLY_ACC=CAM_ASM_000602 /TAXON_ID=2969 /ORGANISM="Oxyrrhis marina" /LENGTH=44 /DNA_ID= /DNA_START= /DNA_END= /DNA_ORIENTATION=
MATQKPRTPIHVESRDRRAEAHTEQSALCSSQPRADAGAPLAFV